MKNLFVVRTILLIAAIVSSSYAEVSVFNIPYNVLAHRYVCTGDYIWYLTPALGEKSSNYRIARLHVPSRISRVFNSNDFGISINNFFSQFIAPDSTHCAVLNQQGDLAYFHGSTWTNLKNRSISFLCSTKAGKILMNSSDFFGYIENDSIKFISRDSIGLSDTPLKAVTSDSLGNIYVMNRHTVAKYNGSTWSVIFQNDSIKLDWISVLPDNFVYLQAMGDTCSYFSKMTSDGLVDYTIEEMDSIRSSFNKYITDVSGNRWRDVTTSSIECNLEMINNNDTVNGNNAQALGWKNWPVFMGDKYGVTSSGKNIYIPMVNGVYHYDGGPGRTWEWISFNQTFDALGILGATTLFESPDSAMYIYSQYGYSVLNKYKDGVFYTFPDMTSSKIFVDHQGLLWTQIDGYLCKFVDPFYKKVVLIPNIGQITEDNGGKIVVLSSKSETYETQIFRQTGSDWEIFNQNNSNLPAGPSIKIVQSPDGKFWLGTPENGVAVSTDLHTWTYFSSSNSTLTSNQINDMVVDKEGNVVVSAVVGNSQISIFKFNGTQWVSMGKPSIQIISKLNVDHYGKIWYGMSYYNGTAWHIVYDAITLNDFKIDYSDKLWAATNDNIYITTNNEFYTFNPQASPVKLNVKENNNRYISIRNTGGSETIINFFLDKPSNIALSIFTLQGKQVAILKNGYQSAGAYNAVWKNNGAKGLYILKYSSPTFIYNVPLRVF